MVNTNELYIRVQLKMNNVFCFLVCKGTEITRIGYPVGDVYDARSYAEKYSRMLGNCPIVWIDGTQLE